MTRPTMLNPAPLFPVQFATRAAAKRVYAQVRDLPIISPHGHIDPAWSARHAAFHDANELLVATSGSPAHPLTDHQAADRSDMGVRDMFHKTPSGIFTPADAEDDAAGTAVDLAYNLPKRAYKRDEPAATCTPELV